MDNYYSHNAMCLAKPLTAKFVHKFSYEARANLI
jgi:hypothetical protein